MLALALCVAPVGLYKNWSEVVSSWLMEARKVGDMRPTKDVNCASDILPVPVVNGAVRELSINRVIPSKFIGRDQADFVVYGFADETQHC